jgi:hypothetical protein
MLPTPLTLSLSKGCPSPYSGSQDESQGFDKLSLIGDEN